MVWAGVEDGRDIHHLIYLETDKTLGSPAIHMAGEERKTDAGITLRPVTHMPLPQLVMRWLMKYETKMLNKLHPCNPARTVPTSPCSM